MFAKPFMQKPAVSKRVSSFRINLFCTQNLHTDFVSGSFHPGTCVFVQYSPQVNRAVHGDFP